MNEPPQATSDHTHAWRVLAGDDRWLRLWVCPVCGEQYAQTGLAVRAGASSPAFDLATQTNEVT